MQHYKHLIMNRKRIVTPSDTTEIEKGKSYIIADIVDYIPDAVATKTIIKKITGHVNIMSFDSGEGLSEKTLPFDTFVQIIEGNAELVIDGIPNLLNTGQGIVIPAHLASFINPKGRFKIIQTIIKSGYE
jgi:quercetin dioxygenase-like cupin family protein